MNRHYLKLADRRSGSLELAVPYFNEAGIGVDAGPAALEFLSSRCPWRVRRSIGSTRCPLGSAFLFDYRR